jgi:hypothetical protein
MQKAKDRLEAIERKYREGTLPSGRNRVIL